MTVESFDETNFWPRFVTFPAKFAPYCGFSRFWFVPGDKGDRLEVAAAVSQKEAGKMTTCYRCTFLASFFWAIFWRLVALLVSNLNLGLLMMLRRVRWQCHFNKRRSGLAMWRAQT